MSALEIIYVITILLYVFTFFFAVSVIEKLARSLRRVTILLKRREDEVNRLKKEIKRSAQLEEIIIASASSDNPSVSDPLLEKSAKERLLQKLNPYITCTRGHADSRNIVTARVVVKNEEQI